jgi:hypothetical protein
MAATHRDCMSYSACPNTINCFLIALAMRAGGLPMALRDALLQGCCRANKNPGPLSLRLGSRLLVRSVSPSFKAPERLGSKIRQKTRAKQPGTAPAA